MKRAILNAISCTPLQGLARILTRRSLRILCYHGLWVAPGTKYGNRLFIDPEQFEDRMTKLARSGRPVLRLSDALEGLKTGRLPSGAVVITIDDGWASTYTHMLPVLERLGLPATVYVTTWYVEHDLPIVNKAVDYLFFCSSNRRLNWRNREFCWGSESERERISGLVAKDIDSLIFEDRLGELISLSDQLGVEKDAWLGSRQFHLMCAEDVKDAWRRGFDVQLHTHRHINLTARIDELARELAENRGALEKMIGDGGDLVHFCYPSGNYHAKADDILRAMCVKSAVLVEQGINHPGANVYRLRRFLDGRTVSSVEFEAYLDGVLHFTDGARSLVRRLGM